MNGPQDIAVSVRDLERRFGKFVAVNRISFDVKPGEIFGFLGPNGAGKSTTIRMLCGILAPTSGGGSVAGFDIITQTEQIKQHIGYMSQRFSLYEDLTVEENLDFYAGVYSIPRDRRAARKDWAVRMAGLTEHRRSRTGPLSGGWKQRLALGCAILHEPPVVFLDEPTSGVDPISRRQFWDLIYELSGQGVTVFVTTHYMDEAEYCGRLGLIYRGELIAVGSGHELKTQHIRQVVLEVSCPGAADLATEIEALPGVREAALFGRNLHVMVDDPQAATAEIEGLLRKRGQAPFSNDEKGASPLSRPLSARIEVIEPSLEDVFVWLIEQYDAERGQDRRGVS